MIKFHHQTCSKLTSMMPLSHTKSAATLLKRHRYLVRGSHGTRARTVDIRSTFIIIDIIYYNIIHGSRFLNNLECSLSNVCYNYISHKNNINKNKTNIFKYEHRDAAVKKRASREK